MTWVAPKRFAGRCICLWVQPGGVACTESHRLLLSLVCPILPAARSHGTPHKRTLASLVEEAFSRVAQIRKPGQKALDTHAD